MSSKKIVLTALALAVLAAAPSVAAAASPTDVLLHKLGKLADSQASPLGLPDSCTALKTKGCASDLSASAPKAGPLPAGDGFVARITVDGAVAVGGVLQAAAGDLHVSVDAYLADANGAYRPFNGFVNLLVQRDCGGLEAALDPTPAGMLTQCQGPGEYLSPIPGAFASAGHVEYTISEADLAQMFPTDAPVTIVRIRVATDSFLLGASDVNLAKDAVLDVPSAALALNKALALADSIESSTPFTPTVLAQLGSQAAALSSDGFTAAIEVAGGIRSGDAIAVRAMPGKSLVVSALVFVDENGWKAEREGLYVLRLFGYDSSGNSVKYPATSFALQPDTCDSQRTDTPNPSTGPHAPYGDCHPGANGRYTWTIPYDALPEFAVGGSGFQVQVQKISEDYGRNVGTSMLFVPRDALLLNQGVKVAPVADSMDAGFTPLVILPADTPAADGYTAHIEVLGGKLTQSGIAVTPNGHGDVVVRAKPYVLGSDGKYRAPETGRLLSLAFFTVGTDGSIERVPADERVLCSVQANGWCTFPGVDAQMLLNAANGAGSANAFAVDVTLISADGERGLGDSYLFAPKEAALAQNGAKVAAVADALDATADPTGQQSGSAFTPLVVLRKVA